MELSKAAQKEQHKSCKLIREQKYQCSCGFIYITTATVLHSVKSLDSSTITMTHTTYYGNFISLSYHQIQGPFHTLHFFHFSRCPQTVQMHTVLRQQIPVMQNKTYKQCHKTKRTQNIHLLHVLDACAFSACAAVSIVLLLQATVNLHLHYPSAQPQLQSLLLFS